MAAVPARVPPDEPARASSSRRTPTASSSTCCSSRPAAARPRPTSGLAAFTIVLRRLRDPQLTSAGVTVLMRYTLRLLTLDQLGRAATLICALELVRQEDAGRARRLAVRDRPVGRARPRRRTGWARRARRTGRRRARRRSRIKNNSRKAAPIPLENCPWCGTKLKPTSFVLTGPRKADRQADRPADQLREPRSACSGATTRCRSSRVDEPIYRRVPCFVIATVDKFASLPWVGASGALARRRRAARRGRLLRRVPSRASGSGWRSRWRRRT